MICGVLGSLWIGYHLADSWCYRDLKHGQGGPDGDRGLTHGVVGVTEVLCKVLRFL